MQSSAPGRTGISRRQYLGLTVGLGAGFLVAARSPSSTPAPAAAPTSAPAAGAQPTAAATSASAAAKPSASTIKMLFNASADPAFVPDFAAFQTLKDQFGVNVDLQQVSGA